MLSWVMSSVTALRAISTAEFWCRFSRSETAPTEDFFEVIDACVGAVSDREGFSKRFFAVGDRSYGRLVFAE